ncbi:MAG: hopanoid C-3 methylase HpnR, partial [Methylosarcina sp.]
ETQKVLFTKHMGWAAARDTASIIGKQLMHGQTNFLRSLWKFDSVFNPKLQLADHAMPVKYQMAPPPPSQKRVDAKSIYIHQPMGRGSRQLDEASERFVDASRFGT